MNKLNPQSTYRMNKAIRLAGAALNQTPIDWDNNTQNIREAISIAKAQGVAILCLPELCITGYGCEDLFLTEWVAETAFAQLLTLLPETEGLTVSIGLPIRYEGKLYNAACLIHDTKILGFSAKQFLANEGVHYETRWFTAWPSEKRVEWETPAGKFSLGDLRYEVCGITLAFEICEDAWVKERPGIRHAAAGVQLILNPSASHFAFHKSAIRYDLVIGGSQRFQCAYVYANLLGNEAGRMIYDGEVLIALNGKLIQRNNRHSFNGVNLITADIDFEKKEAAYTPLNTDDREKELEFWEATSLGLFDYMRKSRSKGFVLSLSGGADSSACAVMVNEMIKQGIKELGVKRFLQRAGLSELYEEKWEGLSFEHQCQSVTKHLLICAYQSTRHSGEATLHSAQSLVASIGATFYHWSVENEVEGYKAIISAALARPLTWENDDIALQNIQARGRAPVIWMLANITRCLLITTSNRSEADVGYATMDGDTAGSIAPIAGVDKHFVRLWLLWAEKHLNQAGLAAVNALQPTAELRPAEKHQTDEKDLMPYEWLVRIERAAIKERRSPRAVLEVLSKEWKEDPEQLKNYIRKFFRLWAQNQWKRERYAPSFHLDDFNVDPRSWCRFPILSGAFQKELEQL
jgi:NAD+ synthase (glutamine-hydrolysing)